MLSSGNRRFATRREPIVTASPEPSFRNIGWRELVRHVSNFVVNDSIDFKDGAFAAGLFAE
jgi:hypothetical protein